MRTSRRENRPALDLPARCGRSKGFGGSESEFGHLEKDVAGHRQRVLLVSQSLVE